jgi:predicted MFS family arabinose efflux permease
VLDRAGPAAATAFVSAVILVFAVCRAVAETGYYPWNQEFVPNDVRGQYGSVLSVVSTLATLAALGLASHVLSHGTGLARFLWLIGAGAAIGGVSVALMLPVPGGVPEPDAPASGKHLSAMRTALRDRNFLAYLGGFGLVTLGSAFGSAFLPLFLTERLGMDPRMVVRMDMAAFAGGLAASFLWGWSADRHGSRPAVVASQSLAVAVPLLWLAVSRHGAAGWLLPAGLCAAGGVAVAGHTIAGGRWLMASVVPEENRTEYMALYYAWMGLAGGAGPILAGAVLAGLPGRGSESNGWAMDGYAALFLAGAAAVFAGLQCYRRVRPDGAFTTRTLAAGALDALLERLPFRR